MRRWLAVFTGVLCTAAPVQAQTLRLAEASALRAERQADAAVLAQLATGSPAELLQLRGGWAQVSAGGRQGWVRASALDMDAAAVGAAAQVNSGRRAAGASAVMLGVRAFPPRANRHALIVGVGEYAVDPQRPAAALAGVKHDMASALTIARWLQVPAANVTLLRDREATRAGIEGALKELAARLQAGDRVFVYWSGHGSRYFDPQEQACVETLVPHDLKDISNREFARWLQPIAQQAEKLMVVYDACHSGGVGGQAVPSRGLAAITAKSTPGPQSCLQPSNLRTRSLDRALLAGGSNAQDVVHIASSRPDEVSFDNPQSGGVATTALRACLSGEAKDLDGSGAISIDEVAACAQARIEGALRGRADVDPPHLVLSGNRQFVPAWFVSPPPAAPSPTPVPTPQPNWPTPAPALPMPTAPAPTASTPAAPVALGEVLAQIHAQRDSRRRVEVLPTATRLRIGVDPLGFAVTSSHAGHVYAALLGSDGRTLTLLFPNALDSRNRIAAGETLVLPRPNWQVLAGGPAGRNQLLVLVTDTPRDLSALGGQPAGPFVQALTDPQGRARLQWLLGSRPGPGGGPCTSACSDAFGSALVAIDEDAR